MARIFFVALTLILSKALPLGACTIFIGSDGKMTLVGNNEDYTPSVKTFLWMRPATAQAHGYAFWGYKEQFPEGGMNDKGLFIDAAALPVAIPVKRDPAKPDYEGYIVETVLRKCSTVEDVLQFVRKYNLTWQEKAQILVADRSGDYAVIHANYIIRKTTPFFAVTNYSLADGAPQDYTCWRRNTAYKYLGGGNLSVEKFRDVLSLTAQREPDNATVYSQVCDLKKGIIYLYRLHDFSKCYRIDLAAELKKGKRDAQISSLFVREISDTLVNVALGRGPQAAIERYLSVANGAHNKEYDLSPKQLAKTGYTLLNGQHTGEAIAIFSFAARRFPQSPEALAGLANSLLLNGDEQKADKEYDALAKLSPGDHYLSLFKRHGDGKVEFRLTGFDGARTVMINIRLADKNTDFYLPLARQGDSHWYVKVDLKPGKYCYNYKVDDSWVNDPDNSLTILNGTYLNSKLIMH